MQVINSFRERIRASIPARVQKNCIGLSFSVSFKQISVQFLIFQLYSVRNESVQLIGFFSFSHSSQLQQELTHTLTDSQKMTSILSSRQYQMAFIIFAATSTLLHRLCSAEVFTALSDMEELLETEAVLINNLEAYVATQDQKLNYLRR